MAWQSSPARRLLTYPQGIRMDESEHSRHSLPQPSAHHGFSEVMAPWLPEPACKPRPRHPDSYSSPTHDAGATAKARHGPTKPGYKNSGSPSSFLEGRPSCKQPGVTSPPIPQGIRYPFVGRGSPLSSVGSVEEAPKLEACERALLSLDFLGVSESERITLLGPRLEDIWEQENCGVNSMRKGGHSEAAYKLAAGIKEARLFEEWLWESFAVLSHAAQYVGE